MLIKICDFCKKEGELVFGKDSNVAICKSCVKKFATENLIGSFKLIKDTNIEKECASMILSIDVFGNICCLRKNELIDNKNNYIYWANLPFMFNSNVEVNILKNLS